ncbi:DUF3102 domain-containing protein [Desulfogranum marinum]|uniref:DUF3102 domain-containing protein n=1 Tax=Desulfogranum marinum TaxID=453220 RepID=UPI00196690A2|nr:DUF3102 domain-containing protein [Desulfogranum marinum]MBM9514696.1 DUF3102 domain-containing protein [Desulfogranum marinum]
MTILPFNLAQKATLPTLKQQAELEYQRKVLWGSRRQNLLSPSEKEKLLSLLLEEITILDHATTENCRKTGEILAFVKQQLPHGEFGKWVAENCPFSHRAALNMMKLYKATLDNPGLSQCKKSVVYLIGTKSFDKHLRKQLEVAAGIYDIKHKEVLQLKLALDNGTVTSDSIELDAFFKKRKELDVKERLDGENKRLINALKKLEGSYRDFIKGYKEATGGKCENEFVLHSKHTVKVLEDAINSIIKGYRKDKPISPEEEKTLPIHSDFQPSVSINEHGLYVIDIPTYPLLPYYPLDEVV